MLPKNNRLPSFLIPKLLKKGKRLRGELFTFVYKKRKEENQSRFAFIVPTKISKKAVVRNKVKRRLRNIVKDELKELKGLDTIFLVKKKAIGKEHGQMKEEVKEIFEKIK